MTRMGLLKSAAKYHVAKSVTDKALGKGTLSTVAAVSMVKKSNARGKKNKMLRK